MEKQPRWPVALAVAIVFTGMALPLCASGGLCC